MPAMTDDDLASAVKVFADEARSWNETQSGDRIKAVEYYDGVMNDTPSDEGRSRVVSRDFRAATKKVLPAITRTILGSDTVVRYEPMKETDTKGAAQASDYVNYVVIPECRGDDVIRDAVHDALRVRNGIIKWWWDRKIDVKVTKHSGLTPEELVALAQDDNVEVLEQGQDYSGLATVKIRRKVDYACVAMACIPLEEFFISPDALTIEDAPFVAHNQSLKRYQLIQMGYDREKVMSLKAATEKHDQDSERTERRGFDDSDYRKTGRLREMDEIDYWECFIRVDADDDGISELRRIVMAGGWDATCMLENDEIDEIPFADIVIERKPHEWQGRSLFDDVHEIQRVKTVLLRNTLDNIYWQNNLQVSVQEQALTPQGMDAVMNPAFGKPIVLKAGFAARDAVQFNPVPFVAQQSFEMLAYMDDALTDRTGISDNSGGLPPDALQNVTAKASALMEQQGINQVELMVRNVATGLKRVFKGVLKLIIQNQDKPRTVRLRDKWVQFDPKSWDASMDATVNVGLGAGTRERDMMAMQAVVALQEKVLVSMGADNPLVKPDQIYNGLARLTQAAGVKNVDAFFTQPDPAEVQAKLQEAASKPSPEEIKAQAQMQIEQGKAQVQIALEEKRMEVEANKEKAQMEADLVVKQKELENDIALRQFEVESQAALEREKMQIEREKMAQQRELELLKLGMQPQEDGSVKTEASMQNEALMAVVQNMQAMAQAMGETIQNMNKPKRVVRDPATGKAIGVETVN